MVQAGITPVTVGLVAATAALLAQTADRSWLLAAVTLAVAAASLATKLHPLWLLGAGAAAGMLVGG